MQHIHAAIYLTKTKHLQHVIITSEGVPFTYLHQVSQNSNAQLNKANQNAWKFNLKQAEKNYKKIINEHRQTRPRLTRLGEPKY